MFVEMINMNCKLQIKVLMTKLKNNFGKFFFKNLKKKFELKKI